MVAKTTHKSTGRATRALVVGVAVAIAAAVGCSRDDRDVERFDGLMPWDRGKVFRQVGTLVDGVKHGPWRLYNVDTGELKFIEHWRHGVEHGPLLAFHDGWLLYDRYYWNGKLHGRMRAFVEDELTELGWAIDDKREGLWCYWDDGRLRQTIVFGRDIRGRTEDWPRRPCPHLEGPGRRHANPHDRNYHWPREPRAPVRRPF